MAELLRDALLVCSKDLRIEARSKVALNQIVPFALVVLVLFGLALGPDLGAQRASIDLTASGLFWIAVLFATVLAVHRAFAIESSNGVRDALRLSGLDPAGTYLGKVAAVAAELIVLEVVLAIVDALLFNVNLSGVLFLICTGVVATACLSAVGILYGALSAGSRVRETLLPLLFMPVVAPVLLAATNCTKAALASAPSSATRWFGLLVGFAIAYAAIGVVAFGPLLEDS